MNTIKGRSFYNQLEYNESANYAALPDRLYRYEKLLVAETYEKNLIYASSEVNKGENMMYLHSKEMEQDFLNTKGAMVTTVKNFKLYAKHIRKRWNNEMIFRLSKESAKVYDPAYNCIIMTKYSPLFNIFNMIMLRLQAGGIIEQNAKFYYLDYNFVEAEKVLKPIEMEHILTGTYGFIIGLALASLAFLVEILQKRKRIVKKEKRVECFTQVSNGHDEVTITHY